MGNLADLWAEWRETNDNDPRKEEIQEEINKVEQWCIDNHIKGFTSLTIWGKTNAKSVLYPWHTGAVYIEDMWMVGTLNGKGKNYESDGKIHICEYCLDKNA